MALNPQEPHPSRERLPAGRPQRQHQAVRHPLQSSPLRRKPKQLKTC